MPAGGEAGDAETEEGTAEWPWRGGEEAEAPALKAVRAARGPRS